SGFNRSTGLTLRMSTTGGHNQIVMDPLNPLGLLRKFPGPVFLSLVLNEAAQLNDALEGCHLHFGSFDAWVRIQRGFNPGRNGPVANVLAHSFPMLSDSTAGGESERRRSQCNQ